jgi:DNA polymerase-3 subunit delta
MTYEAIEKSWAKGDAKPVYVFHGEEDFLRTELLHELPAMFLPDEGTRSFNYDLLYGSEVSLKDVISIAQGYPVMADRRVVIVRDAEKIVKVKAATKSGGSSKKAKESQEDPLLAYLKNPNLETILIFDMQKMGPRNQSPFKELSTKAECVEFLVMKDAAVVQWVRKRATVLGRSLSESAARLMVAHLGTSLRVHANELDKLVTFTDVEDKVKVSVEITEKDVERVVGVSREFNIFELQKAIGSCNKALAIKIAFGMLSSGSEQRQFLFAMLAKYIEQLIVAREMQARGDSEQSIADALELRGGAAFFVKEYIQTARRYTKERLDNAMRSIVKSELQTRRIAVDDSLLIEKLVLDLVPSQ